MCSVYEDVELLNWLRSSQKNGPSFVRALAEAAFMADLSHYHRLRPLLVELKKEYPMTDKP
jgi:hypothetical protein